jgi:hypothetical protein
MFRSRNAFFLTLLLLPITAVTANGQGSDKTPAMKIREVLDQPITLDLSASSLKEIARQLSDKTGVKFTVDVSVSQFPGSDGNLVLKADKAKLNATLRRFLAQYYLAYSVLEDSVVITSEDWAVDMQLCQLITVSFEDIPLRQALKQLHKTTPFNYVIDPRVDRATNRADRSISVDLENTQLESVVSMMAEMAELKTVVVDNAIFITLEEHADKIRAEQKASAKKPRGNSPNGAPPQGTPFGVPAGWPAGMPGMPPGAIMPGGPGPFIPGPFGPGPEPIPPPAGRANPAAAAGSLNWKIATGINLSWENGGLKFGAGANWQIIDRPLPAQGERALLAPPERLTAGESGRKRRRLTVPE